MYLWSHFSFKNPDFYSFFAHRSTGEPLAGTENKEEEVEEEEGEERTSVTTSFYKRQFRER